MYLFYLNQSKNHLQIVLLCEHYKSIKEIRNKNRSFS